VIKGFAKVKMMYPLLLKPPIKDYLWGGTKLKTDFGFETEKEIVAEAWMLSCHKDGMNIVMNGEYKGKTINDVLEIWGKSALGKNAEKFSYFPILIKLIDAKQKLSVQVHPDDKYALSVEGEYGKTEMWYVVDCEPRAKLAYGFKKKIDKNEFEQRIKDNTLDEVINYVPVKKGEVFFIKAGTMHAIGEGILIAEVQQNSNTTYRVSDYGRLGADGKPRELHVEKALEVTKLEHPHIPYGNIGKVFMYGENTIRELSTCDKFSANLLSLNTTIDLYSSKSFISLVVLNGSVNIVSNDTGICAKKGSSIFIPAGLEVSLVGQAEILYSYV
jgi:mannose-6-phosphate isomerase